MRPSTSWFGAIDKEGYMNVLNMQRLLASLVLATIVLGGCVTSQPIPELSQPQSSGLVIDVLLKAPIGIFSAKPDQVYFAKVDGEDGLLQQQIIRSNYSKDGRAYLLNARPGTYVAVAAFLTRAGVPAGPPAPGFSISVTMGTSGYTTYFSKELVEQTRVTVRENDFVFMGSYVLDQSTGLEGADAVQAHYKNVIAPGATTNVLLMGMSGNIHYRGTLIERRNDEQTRSEFFKNANEDLAGSAWATRLSDPSRKQPIAR